MTDSTILVAARALTAARARCHAAEVHAAELHRARDRGEDVAPTLAHATTAGKVAYESEIAAGDLILTVPAETAAEALVQLAVGVARLNWLACSVPEPDTPETAERIERGLLSALAVLLRLAPDVGPDVRAFVAEHVNLDRDVLHLGEHKEPWGARWQPVLTAGRLPA